MTKLRLLWSRARMRFRPREVETELAEEIRSHLEMQEDDHRAHGMAADDARRAALRDFGGVDLAKERYRDGYRFLAIESFLHDSLLGFRMLRKTPGFAMTAILTLALGIGASTAIFSVVQAVFLRSLPYRDPGRLAAVWTTSTREQQTLSKLFAVYGDYIEFRNHAKTLESVSAATWDTADRVLTGVGSPRQVFAIPASASFFDTLGVHAEIGRTFSNEDEQRGCSIVLGHKIWASVFNSDPSIAGKTITLDEKPCDVLGVMPREFSFYPRQSDAWILLRPGFQPNQRMFVGIFARLKPGVTLAQAQSELQGLFRAIHTDAETRDFEPRVYDLHDEFTFLASRTLRSTLRVVFIAVLLVLLIACLNVANLQLARLSARQREMAVRAALGSSRSRLLRQVLAESLILSSIGAVLGTVLAYLAVHYFRQASPIELSVGSDVTINLPVLLFSAALSIVTTIFFGFLPAFRASRVDVTQTLKTAGRGVIQGGQRLASVLVAFEIAATFVLLIGAGLLMTSALRMGSESLGFNPNGLVATGVSLPNFRYVNGTQRLSFYNTLLARLKGSSGTAAVALTSKVPPQAGGNQTLEIQGRPVVQGAETHDIGADAVSPGFFDVLNIPIRRGRVFNDQDRENSQPVAVVNEALVNEYFPNMDPIGQQIRIPGGAMPWLTIVGVVGNLKHTELMNEMRWVETPIVYGPLAQDPRPSIQIALRTVQDTAFVTQEVQQLIAELDPSIPSGEIEPLTSRLSKTLAYPRFRAILFTSFALTGLFLSVVGLHGVLSQFIGQRTMEFGLRRAVGAQTYNLFFLVAQHGGTPVIAGLVLGIVLSFALTRALRSMLYGIHWADPAILISVSATLLVAAALAILLPARRAAGIDPMVALRDE